MKAILLCYEFKAKLNLFISLELFPCPMLENNKNACLFIFAVVDVGCWAALYWWRDTDERFSGKRKRRPWKIYLHQTVSWSFELYCKLIHFWGVPICVVRARINREFEVHWAAQYWFSTKHSVCLLFHIFMIPFCLYTSCNFVCRSCPHYFQQKFTYMIVTWLPVYSYILVIELPWMTLHLVCWG